MPIIVIIISVVLVSIVGGAAAYFKGKRSNQVAEDSKVTVNQPAANKPKPKTGLTPQHGNQASTTNSMRAKPSSYESPAQKPRDPWRDPIPAAPTNLALPILVEEINVTDELLSPYGIIRKSGDGGIGHGGIDFPLERGSPVYAVADGTVIKNDSEDVGGGNTVDILILPGGFPGEGWIFKYEHINLEPGLAVNSNVKKGQKIGTNAFQQRGNNHIGLEYHIRNFTIASYKICWVDRLEPIAREQLENAFNMMKKTPAFIQSWQTATTEGYYQYRGLLDKTKYPDGPQLCYPLGTDARIPVY